MKNLSAFFLAGGLAGSLLLGNACTTPSSSPPVQKQDSAPPSFLPVADYLRGEISYVDSTPLAILKHTVRDNRSDSAFIQQGEFNRLAVEFLAPELDPALFSKNFTETSFMDKTTGYLTFTYSTPNKTLSLQRVDVLVAPGNTADKIKSIYLEKISPAGDTSVVKKMFWETGRNFQILTSRRLPGKPPLEEQLKVIWDTDQ
ncbi:MAG TPA: hypothetical protein VNS58_17195 [Puia sp.]|nr:hypothetical protein [Puia sp.]